VYVNAWPQSRQVKVKSADMVDGSLREEQLGELAQPSNGKLGSVNARGENEAEQCG
jgi:hypothetical protein